MRRVSTNLEAVSLFSRQFARLSRPSYYISIVTAYFVVFTCASVPETLDICVFPTGLQTEAVLDTAQADIAAAIDVTKRDLAEFADVVKRVRRA